jgi:ribosomal-protein-serine acetyltransferase
LGGKARAARGWRLGAATLRRLVPADRDTLYAAIDRDRHHLRVWLPWVDSTRSPADLGRFLEETVQLERAGAAARFAIACGGRLAGVVSLEGIDGINRSAMIGYWIGLGHQGRGLVTRAVARLCEHAFLDLGLHRIEIHAAPENRRSCAIPERLGFTHEGTRRACEWINDRFVDHAIYALLAPEWRARRA